MTKDEILNLGLQVFYVSPDLIKAGSRICSTACPIALAIRSGVNAHTVSVCPEYIRLRSKDGYSLFYNNPFSDWMTSFDKGEEVEAFYFKLNLANTTNLLAGLAYG